MERSINFAAKGTDEVLHREERRDYFHRRSVNPKREEQRGAPALTPLSALPGRTRTLRSPGAERVCNDVHVY